MKLATWVLVGRVTICAPFYAKRRRAKDFPPFLADPVTPDEEIDAVVQQVPQE
jgi:hypothetical protein